MSATMNWKRPAGDANVAWRERPPHELRAGTFLYGAGDLFVDVADEGLDFA
jgi:hypothetical protein